MFKSLAFPGAIALLLNLGVGSLAYAQSTSPTPYGTTNGNEIGSNPRDGSATPRDRETVSDVVQRTRALRDQPQRPQPQPQSQPASTTSR